MKTRKKQSGISILLLKLTLLLTAEMLSTGTLFGQLSGTYTLGPGQDYATFSAACSDLGTLGISGAVVFNVSPGTYTEQFTVPYVANATEVNTITFQSASGNADDVIVQYEAVASDANYLVKVKQSNYLTLKGMTFNALGDIYSNAITIENYAFYLTIESCKFSGHYDTNNRERSALIAGSDIGLQHLTIRNNYFVDGSFAVFLNCSAEYNLYTKISNNTMVDMGYTGILLNKHEYTEVFDNSISNSSIGMHLIGSSSGIVVHSNKILQFRSDGIDISGMKSAPGFESYIYNNTIIGHQYANSALKFNSSSYVNIYNNTLVLDNLDISAKVLHIAYSVHQTMNVVNNNIVAVQQGYALYVHDAEEVKNCDYNNIYSAGRLLSFWGEKCEDLRTLKAVSGQNEHSIFAYPNFISESVLKPNSAWLDGAGTPLAIVTEDIDGISRDPVSPDIGAYEFEADPGTKPPLNGIKTIGAGGDYASLNEAISDVQVKGIDATLRLQFLPAYYNEQCIIPPITGANSNHPLILESSTSNSSDVHIWYNAEDAEDNYLLKLKGASFLQIRDLSFHAMDPRFARILFMEGMVDSLYIQNCSLKSTEQGDANSNATVVHASDLNYHLQTFENDSIFFGSTSINMNMGQELSAPGEIRLINNYIESGYMNLITRDVNSVTIKDNYLTSNYYGLSLSMADLKLNIEKNYIYSRYGACIDLNGIGFEDFTRGQVINNFLVSDYSNPNRNGFVIYNCEKLDIYYNSIGMLSETANYPAKFENSSSLKMNNNIFSNKASSMSFYTKNTSYANNDYNCFYSQGTDLAYWNSACTDLAALQSASGGNLHSLSVNPGFTSDTDLHIITDLLDGKGVPISGIEFDFDGQSRDLNNPDIGADEFGSVPNQPPVVEKPIPDQVFEWNTPPQEIALLDTVFSDPDAGDVLSYEVESSENWVFPSITNNVLTVATSEGSSGITQIMVTASDQMMAEVSDTFNLEYFIPAENHAPVAVDDTVITHEAMTIEVLLNDYDVDGDELTIVSYAYHGSGNVSLNNDSTAIHYVPLQIDDTPDTIRYYVEDSMGAGDSAMVFIHLYRLMEGLNDIEAGLEGLSHGTIRWGDYDDDGDLDILQTGWTGTSMEFRTKLIANKGNDEFEDTGIQFLGVSAGTSSSAEWIDFDNDNDLDICVAGRMDGDASIYKVLIYENEGGSFSHYTDFDFTGTTSCSMSWGDVNHDGMMDMFISGSLGSTQEAWMYMGKGENGSGWQFSEELPPVTGSQNGEVSLTDLDGDGDLDLFMCGGYMGVARLYLYEDGTFEELASGLPDFTNASAEWADFDGDGDPDLAIMGRSDDVYKCQIYENVGFSGLNVALLELYQEFEGIESGDIAWADFDLSGEIDLAVTGNTDAVESETKILLNDDGVFTEENFALAGLGRSSLAWGDYDNDGDPDLVLQGIDGFDSKTVIYRNDCGSVNLPPVIVGNTRSTKESNRYTISWDPATDDSTPQDAISYNVRLGTTSKGTDIISPMSVGGFLKTPRLGNAGYNTFIELPVLQPGEYYLGIQAIDQSFAASGFTMDAYLEVTGLEDEMENRNFEIYPNPATEKVWINVLEEGTYWLQLIDLTGRTLISNTVDMNAEDFMLDISTLNPGTYMLLMRKDGKVGKGKLMVR